MHVGANLDRKLNQSAASSSLIFAMAAAGLRPFGHVRAQLKIVWHRYRLSSFCSFSLRFAPYASYVTPWSVATFCTQIDANVRGNQPSTGRQP